MIWYQCRVCRETTVQSSSALSLMPHVSYERCVQAVFLSYAVKSVVGLLQVVLQLKFSRWLMKIGHYWNIGSLFTLDLQSLCRLMTHISHSVRPHVHLECRRLNTLTAKLLMTWWTRASCLVTSSHYCSLMLKHTAVLLAISLICRHLCCLLSVFLAHCHHLKCSWLVFKQITTTFSMLKILHQLWHLWDTCLRHTVKHCMQEHWHFCRLQLRYSATRLWVEELMLIQDFCSKTNYACLTLCQQDGYMKKIRQLVKVRWVKQRPCGSMDRLVAHIVLMLYHQALLSVIPAQCLMISMWLQADWWSPMSQIQRYSTHLEAVELHMVLAIRNFYHSPLTLYLPSWGLVKKGELWLCRFL